MAVPATEVFSFHNPVFKAYLFYNCLLVLKMMFMSLLTGSKRMKYKVICILFHNWESFIIFQIEVLFKETFLIRRMIFKLNIWFKTICQNKAQIRVLVLVHIILILSNCNFFDNKRVSYYPTIFFVGFQ